MTKLFIAFLLVLSLEIAAPIHGFHVSFCTVEFDEKNQILAFSLNLVLDDIEQKLEKEGTPKLNLCTENEHEKGEYYLMVYLREHFKIEINGVQKDWEWVGKEITEELDGVWCYFQVSDLAQLNSMKLKNDILINELEDQKNIVDIIGPGGKKGYLMFFKGNTSGSLEF